MMLSRRDPRTGQGPDRPWETTTWL